ncbi:MAG: hypothetical protein ACOZQL_38010 [Myxococcota bacterium]
MASIDLPEPIRRLTCPADRVLLGVPGASREVLTGVEVLEVPATGLPLDGSVYGSFATEGVCVQLRVELRAGRLLEVLVEVDVPDAELEPTAEVIAAHWGLRLARKGKGRRFTASRPLEASVPASLQLEAKEIQTGGDPLFRVTLRAVADDPASVTPLEAPVSPEALAAALAVPGMSVEACVAALSAHSKTGARSVVPPALRAELAKLAPEALQPRTRALLRQVDAALHGEPDAFRAALAGLEVREGGWLRVGPELRRELVNTLAVVGARETFVDLVVDGLDFGGPAAVDALVAAAARVRAEQPSRALRVPSEAVRLDDPDALQDAVFAVLTAGMSPADVVRSGRNSWVEARVAARALTPHVGPPPDFTTAQLVAGLGKRAEPEENWRRASVYRAQLLAQARRIDPALFRSLLEAWSYDEAAVFLNSDEQVVTPAVASYRLGARLMTYRRSPKGKQLVTVTDCEDEAGAAAKLGGAKKKKAPARRPAAPKRARKA